MKEFTVKVTEQVTYEVVVEAENEADAFRLGIEQASDHILVFMTFNDGWEVMEGVHAPGKAESEVTNVEVTEGRIEGMMSR